MNPNKLVGYHYNNTKEEKRRKSKFRALNTMLKQGEAKPIFIYTLDPSACYCRYRSDHNGHSSFNLIKDFQRKVSV